MAKPDGGPAFPSIVATRPGEWATATNAGGMSLRDYFAGLALQGWIASFTESSRKEEADAKVAAMVAYQFADAMLAEREKK